MVAVRRAHVLRVVVPRAAPDHAVGGRSDRHPKTIRLHPASRLQMSPGGEGYALFNSIVPQSPVLTQSRRCARRVAVSALLRTLRLAPLPRSAHDPLPELGTAEAQVADPDRGLVEAARYAARTHRATSLHEPPRITRWADAESADRRARLLSIVFHPNILAPLPDIPQHVVQAPGICLLPGHGVCPGLVELELLLRPF